MKKDSKSFAREKFIMMPWKVNGKAPGRIQKQRGGMKNENDCLNE